MVSAIGIGRPGPSVREAAASARWAGARLPTEAEWETAIGSQPPGDHDDNQLHRGLFHPTVAPPVAPRRLVQMIGDVWEWTQSPYAAYPGFTPAPGAVGEYNGKFMVNQMVLRGGCCVTPRGHVRPTYRNFFPPDARWAFAGLRLARDGDGVR